jgi:DNA processing protein
MSACAACLRRTWLLGELSGVLDRHAPRPDRLDDILALEDVALIEAVAGSRRAEVGAAYETFAPAADGGPSTCVHAAGSSAALTRTGTIALSCDASRLEELLGPPAVLICGTRAPSDYGAQVAHDLARGAAAAGVTVAVVALPGIASAALRGALAGGGMPMLAARGGIAASAGLQRGVAAAVRRSGCVLALLPATRPPARWGVYAAQRSSSSLRRTSVSCSDHASLAPAPARSLPCRGDRARHWRPARTR